MGDSVPDAFIFMKVGDYGEDTLEKIVERKQRELNEVGETYWAYGGKTGRGPLHPKNQIQPFAGKWMKEPGSVQVLMEKIDGGYNIELPAAKKYSAVDSVDEKDWNCLPSGIYLSQTKWALVLDEIMECDLTIDLREFEVHRPGKKAINATQYMAFRGMKELTGRKRGANKGCLVTAESTYDGPDAPKAEVCVSYKASLKFPYAVFLK